MFARGSLMGWAMVGVLCLALPASALACPFCSAVSLTFSEEMQRSDVAVLAKRVPKAAPPAEGIPDPSTEDEESGRTAFEIVEVLRGGEFLPSGKFIETIYFGENPPETTFLVLGIEPPVISWGTPIPLSSRAVEYVRQLPQLEEKSDVERLAFFLDYLEDEDEMLARDTYDEFAKAAFETVQELEDQLPHEKLLAWIDDPRVPATRRRLYLTMLGVCGSEEDLPLLEEMMRSEDRQRKAGLDAMINSYLMLKGPEGLKLAEELFLSNPDADYTDTYAAIMAIRVHGEEVKTVPRERLVKGLRKVLERPELADLVINDLARWNDWEVTDRLVELFKNADEQSSWVRVPVINFLRASPQPEAKEYLAELSEIDPEAYKRASAFVVPSAQPSSEDPAAEESNDVVDETTETPPEETLADASEGTSEEVEPVQEPVQNEDTVEQPAEEQIAASESEEKDATTDAVQVAAVQETNQAGHTEEPAPTASRTTFVVAPLVIAGALACLMWVILRGSAPKGEGS